MKEFNLKILTSNRKVYDGEARKVITSDSQGQIGIYARHSNYITSLVPCKTTFEDENGKINELFTSNGIMSITDGTVTMLCDSAEFKEEIDKNRAEQARERAKKRLSEHGNGVDLKRAEIALKRAMVRINM